MSFEVGWLIEGRVIDGKDDSQTVEELHEGMQRIMQMIEESGADVVHAVMDISAVSFGATALKGREMEKATRDLRQNNRFKYASCYGVQNMAMMRVLQTMFRFMGVPVFFSETKEQAYAKLREADKTLPEYP